MPHPPFQSELDNSVESLKKEIVHHLKFSLAHSTESATMRDWWIATCKTIQDRIVERMIASITAHKHHNVRRIHYLSLEFLMGRLFNNNLYNVGIHDEVFQALRELGLDPDIIRNEEYDMGLGNGGLGRLASCFLDSMATLDLPAVGYGIHYEFGLFRQKFVNGYQVEFPDNWMKFGDPWEIIRPEYSQTIQLYGEVERVFDERGNYRCRWVNTRSILGIPYDIPICGYRTRTVNLLRLWESKATEEFDLNAFSEGAYVQAVRQKNLGETISKVLYPNDKTENGKELRLVQQYFFVACSLRDMIRRFHAHGNAWTQFPEKMAIQLNDTHPAVAIPELMRILHDEELIPWEEAWSMVTRTFSYTNHTLLPEALEHWNIALFSKVLPRHAEIIFEINKRHLAEVEKKWPGDVEKKRDLSLIDENGQRAFRMAHLAIVGSHSVNGVAELHTRLLKQDLFPNFDLFFPGRFNNKTNGVTPRRWLLSCNPRLSALITEKLGDEKWVTDLERLRGLEKFAEDSAFQKRFMEIKHQNKVDLAAIIQQDCNIEINPRALFDVQIKRLHEYKRQHLNLLHILALYRRLLQNPKLPMQPRVFIFGAKAAPGYDLAKTIIKAINAVADKINHDPIIEGKLKVAFLPNYRVSLAQRIIPGADLSEQISTAGKEASGTGNMKLALNGALTIGTLDGANVEILEEVGAENIFIFGLKVEEVKKLIREGYNPRTYYDRNEELRTIVDWLGSNHFTPNDPHGVLGSLRHSLLEGGDPYLVLADFEAYSKAQEQVDAAYRDPARWARMAILNTARVGKFSSDRTIREYAKEIWHLDPVTV